ncbi:putative Ig domain-containing protein [Streptomyces sp. NPDC029003]|uniref:putative Ig domain-containing protein n=1 Tax=Streptomyces sp. NPDC029003 TaxID=3155125 RepID=UPI00340D0FC7
MAGEAAPYVGLVHSVALGRGGGGFRYGARAAASWVRALSDPGFGATGLPAGLTVDKSTGVVSGTATAWGFRDAALTVTDASDASGRKSTVTTTFTVWS